MFLVFGLLVVAIIILTALYFFIFRRMHWTVNVLVLGVICGLMVLTLTLHKILLAFITMSIGVFVVYGAKIQRDKQKQAN